MNKRMSLIVFSGTVDKLTAVATLATGAAAMGAVASPSIVHRSSFENGGS